MLVQDRSEIQPGKQALGHQGYADKNIAASSFDPVSPGPIRSEDEVSGATPCADHHEESLSLGANRHPNTLLGASSRPALGLCVRAEQLNDETARRNRENRGPQVKPMSYGILRTRYLISHRQPAVLNVHPYMVGVFTYMRLIHIKG